MRLLTRLVLGLIVLCLGSLMAAPIFPATQCTATPGAIVITNPTDILFLNSTWTAAGFQCEQNDKLFSDFSGVGVPSDVKMELILQGTPGNDVHTINFTGNLNVPFTVSFTVTVDPMSAERIFKVAADLQDPGHTGNPSVTKNIQDVTRIELPTTASFLGGPGVPTLLLPTENQLMVTDVFTPGGGAATGFGNSFFQATVPEPGTTALFGAGLLALGFLSRRRRTV